MRVGGPSPQICPSGHTKHLPKNLRPHVELHCAPSTPHMRDELPAAPSSRMPPTPWRPCRRPRRSSSMRRRPTPCPTINRRSAARGCLSGISWDRTHAADKTRQIQRAPELRTSMHHVALALDNPPRPCGVVPCSAMRSPRLQLNVGAASGSWAACLCADLY